MREALVRNGQRRRQRNQCRRGEYKLYGNRCRNAGVAATLVVCMQRAVGTLGMIGIQLELCGGFIVKRYMTGSSKLVAKLVRFALQ